MNAMTRALGAILITALIAAPAAALAENKIGVVKLNRLFEEAPQALALQRSLTEEFAPRERDIRAKREELAGIEEKLKQGEGFLSEEERRRLEQSFRDGQRDLQRAQNEFVEDLNLRRNERLGDLQRLFISEIQAYSQAQKYDLVIVEGFIHASDSIDITQQVLQVLQRRHQGG
ncbi:MAG: OmpH family outer membrane protein [Gammaproteobacteria bacterium]